MQIVSENWKNAHKQSLLNESFVEISFDVADPSAIADATPSDNGAIYISNSSELTDELDRLPTPYCTLEQNLWVLDGYRQSIPVSDYTSRGYVSDVLSDEMCVFSGKIPTITLDFSHEFTNYIPGITITWSTIYGEFPRDFIVRTYNGDTLVSEKEITGNTSSQSLVIADISGYTRIVILIKKWCLPHHRARVEQIFIGLNRVYTKADLFSYSHTQSVNPLSIALPKNEIKFSIDNTADDFNPYNESGLAKYLTKRQEINTRYGLKQDDGTIEWIKGGTFYLSEWSAKQNSLTADFTARDLLEFMSAIYYDSHDLSSRSFYDLAEMVLYAADLPLHSNGNVRWIIDDSLKSKSTTAPLPEDTLANLLQLIANASECVLYQDREGILHIEPLRDEETDYSINSFNSYSKSEVTLSKPIKQVDVKVYTYTIGDRGIESTSTTHSVLVGATGEVITMDNPLVTDTTTATLLGEWVATHLGHRMTLDSSWRADVRLDALDMVTIENTYNTNKVRMTDVEFKYNGAFRGTGEGKVI